MKGVHASRAALSGERLRAPTTPPSTQRKIGTPGTMPDASAASRAQQQHQNRASSSRQSAQLRACADVMKGSAAMTVQHHAEVDTVQGKSALGTNRVDGLSDSNPGSVATTQLKPVPGKVIWGVTHAVKETNGSILGSGDFINGEIGPWGELKFGEVVTVDDDDLFMSRRGANQEVEEIRIGSQSVPPQVEWIRATRIKGVDVSGLHVFIRRETIDIGEDVDDPEALWKPLTIEDVHWNDDRLLNGVQLIGEEYEKITAGRHHPDIKNICSTPGMDQDDEGTDVARDLAVEEYRSLSDFPPESKARTRVAMLAEGTIIGVMQLSVEVEPEDQSRFLYIKWLLGSRSNKGSGVALVRSALQFAIEERIETIKVESAMSAVAWYNKRGFSKTGNTQHMNDKEVGDEDVDIDCGCADMQLQFRWSD